MAAANATGPGPEWILVRKDQRLEEGDMFRVMNEWCPTSNAGKPANLYRRSYWRKAAQAYRELHEDEGG